VGRRANPLPRLAGGMSTAARSFKPNPRPSHTLALTVPVETAQETTGKRKGLSAALVAPPPEDALWRLQRL
jgi:thymidylate kinase